MLDIFDNHNQFRASLVDFEQKDPHLSRLTQFKYQHSSDWWKDLSFSTPGIYILTGGRQIGKSTSCKLLIRDALTKKHFQADNILYLPCDEIFNAEILSTIVRGFLAKTENSPFLLIIDEITFVKNWDRVIKALADEGWFQRGLCLLTGSDTLILKEAAMSFPGRRGEADKTDFHLYPLTFSEYVALVEPEATEDSQLALLYNNYLICGGYLRAINDLAMHGKIMPATYQTYEQWIRGDFLKNGKNENYLLAILQALFSVNVSQISYSTLTHNIGLMSKETCIGYCNLLERMDVLFNLQAYDQNKKQGFPRKARKFHFLDPFIMNTVHQWLIREGNSPVVALETTLVESSVASHCYRYNNSRNKTFYFKGQGEVDVIWLSDNKLNAIEIKWANQLRSADLKTLRQFKDGVILTKNPGSHVINEIKAIPVYRFLYELRG